MKSHGGLVATMKGWKKENQIWGVGKDRVGRLAVNWWYGLCKLEKENQIGGIHYVGAVAFAIWPCILNGEKRR